MSKWFMDKEKKLIRGIYFSDENGVWKFLANPKNDEIGLQIVREHNAHAELVSCLKAMLKITCGECRGEKPGKCAADPLACALSAQARAAIEAAEGRKDE